jgi:molecular chaperone HscB
MRDAHAGGARCFAALLARMPQMNPDFRQDHFSLFGLPARYAIDRDALDRAYREIQSRVHPDRHASAGDAERRASMQWSTRVNEAYRTLGNAAERARYLLELNGVDPGLETDTGMPVDFLQSQMELRESLEDARERRDDAALDALHASLAGERASLETRLAEALDARRDYPQAAIWLRKLMFLDRLGAEIDEALAQLDA